MKEQSDIFTRTDFVCKTAIGMREEKSFGASSIGGFPPNCEGFIWPEYEGRSLQFLAKLDLSEIPPIHEWLPSRGTLLFFYDFIREPWGFDPEEQGWEVLYFENSQVLKGPVTIPETVPAEFLLEERFLSFEKMRTFPSLEHPVFEALDLSEEEFEKYDQEYESSLGIDSPSQIGGYSRAASGTFYCLQAEWISEGIYLGDGFPEGSEETLEEDLAEAEKKWVILFEYEWEGGSGDDMRISFLIPRGDTKRNDYSKVQVFAERS